MIDELTKCTSSFKGAERFVCLAFDEIKVEENLVFDKSTGDLVGFVDLGDVELNFSTFENTQTLASYVMIFLVRALIKNFKFSLAYFGTTGMTATQIMLIFWDAVSLLEMRCNLPVICAVCDGASSNRKFFKMNKFLDDAVTEVVHRSVNLFAKDYRFIYFFSDAPHLMKTARNCLQHSGESSKSTRLLWNDGKELVWFHLWKLVNDDINRPNPKIPKLTMDHVNLTSYSCMKVKYATEILSKSVANLLRSEYPGTEATAKFCEYFDMFFDCLNVRNLYEARNTLKPFTAPYKSTNDPRFEWLEDKFLPYLQSWKDSIKNRPGKFTANDREKMFISYQTHEGIMITTKSLIETARYLLRNGANFFLSVNTNQDFAEEHIGYHRRCGGTNSNPDLFQIGYQENKLRNQKNCGPVTGNTSGRHKYKRQREWSSVDDQPLPKRIPGRGSY